MPPEERFPPDDPRAWPSRGRSNLARAGESSDDVFFEDLCFDAQQAAEKALKALCMHRSLEFPYVHDLSTLITLLQQEGETIPEEVQEQDG
jgi:HEPN domain-containing protein